jgi:hypothetical protein
MRYSILLILIPVALLAFPSFVRQDNPAMIFDGPRVFLNLSEMNLSLDLDQNALTLVDASNLVGGEKIVIDPSRLELLKDGLKIFPNAFVDESVWLGFGSFRLGANLKAESDVSASLPYDLFRVIFGDVNYTENIEKEFSLFKGSVSLKLGGMLGFGLGDFKFAFSGGAFLPVISFDPDKKIKFYYYSDEDTATVQTGISGSVRMLSALPSIKNFDNLDVSEMLNNAGYYLDAGILWKPGKFEIAFAVNNITIKPAVARYEGYAEVSYSATYSNFELETSDPSFDVPDDLTPLSSPDEVSMNMKCTAAVSYDMGYLQLGAHAKFVPDISTEWGIYAGLLNFLWIDLTNTGSAWKKSVGIELDLRLIGIKAMLGVIDYGGLLNIDPSKMTGLSVSAGFGLGF